MIPQWPDGLQREHPIESLDDDWGYPYDETETPDPYRPAAQGGIGLHRNIDKPLISGALSEWWVAAESGRLSPVENGGSFIP